MSKYTYFTLEGGDGKRKVSVWVGREGKRTIALSPHLQVLPDFQKTFYSERSNQCGRNERVVWAVHWIVAEVLMEVQLAELWKSKLIIVELNYTLLYCQMKLEEQLVIMGT